MQNLFATTFPIFLIALLGSIIKRNWLSSEEFWRGLEKLLYFLLFPSVLFNYISVADLSGASVTKLVLCLMISTSIISIALVVYQRKNNIDGILFTSIFQGSIRYNTYIFLGLSSALFGSEGLAIVAIISSYMIIFTNILSVMIFAAYIPSSINSKNRIELFILVLKLIITNPLIIASILGFIFNYSGLKLHLGVQNTIASLSDSALAIGMLNVGAGLKFIICPARFRPIFFTTIVKLMIFPIITVIILSIMSISSTTRSIGILYSCLPCASTAYVLSRQLGGDYESMASIITFTTIFSLVSLPIFMYLLG
jgi:malonate transporter